MADLELLFCRPRTPQVTEDRMDLEVEAADELGIRYHSTCLEDVVDGELERALEELPGGRGRQLLYRGWMLTEEEYGALHEAVLTRGHSLVVTPDEYAAAHYLPNYYQAIEELTAPSRWTWSTDPDEAWEAARELGEGPFLLKDHVKSAKERWNECCFVPRGASKLEFCEVCENLVEARGARFERGLVVREYLPLRQLAASDGTPVSYEFRIFFADGRPIASELYDDVDAPPADLSTFDSLGHRIDSPFFTADVAALDSGKWMVVEIGDGGVSTLPALMDPREFYRALMRSGLGDR
jgi:ATP-grasp domain, R2K clade family 3